MVKHYIRSIIITSVGLAAANCYADFTSNLPSFTDFVNTPQQFAQDHPLVVPAAGSLFAPQGFGADLGVVGVTGTGVNKWPGGSEDDGSATVGIGLGNGDRYVGLELDTLIDSLGVHEPFGQNGNIGLKAFRWITPSTSVAFGVGNPAGWGVFNSFAETYYGSLTQLVSLFELNGYQTKLSITVGAGSGALYSADDFQNNIDSNVQPFGAIAFSPIPNTNLIVDDTSNMISTGISISPLLFFPQFNSFPVAVVVTGYATNLAGENSVPGGVTYGGRLTLGYNFL